MEPDIESPETPFLAAHNLSEQYSDKSQYPGNYDIHKAATWQSEKRKRPRIWSILQTLLAAWGVVTLGIAAMHAIFPSLFQIADVYRPETLKPDLNLCDCGTSLAEATTRGCVYDSLAAGWLPPHCRDDELTREFEQSGPGVGGAWSFYADSNGSIPLSKSQMATLGPQRGTFWATRDWHVAHCLFYWQKYKRMASTGVIMEKRFDSLHHVKHCTHLALVPPPRHFFLLEVPVRMDGKDEMITTKTTEDLGVHSMHN